MWRSLLWVVAFALTAGVGYVAIDAAQRAGTLSTFTRGMGTPDNPSPREQRAAEQNLFYLVGLVVGAGTGLGAAGAASLWWRLALRRHSDAAPGTSSCSGDAVT